MKYLTKGLSNEDGKLTCSICEETFVVYTKNLTPVQFCPCCGATEDNFRDDGEEG